MEIAMSYTLPGRIVLIFVFALAAVLGGSLPGMASETVLMPSALLRITETIHVAAATTGLLSRTPPAEGAMVEKGQVISQVDYKKSKLELNRAAVNLQTAEKRATNDVDVRYAVKAHAVALADLQRSKRINAEIANSVSQKELDRLQLIVDRASLEIEQARHKRELASLDTDLKRADYEIFRHELERSVIRASVTGMVMQVDKRLGEWVNSGDTVVQIVRMDRLRAEGFVPTTAAATSLRGHSAIVSAVLPGTKEPIELRGTVAFVSPIADALNGQVRVWVDFDNADGRLRPGLRVDVKISTDADSDGTTTDSARTHDANSGGATSPAPLRSTGEFSGTNSTGGRTP